jgi:two-component system alkaline phosphatase synthesis response regulator PhoP
MADYREEQREEVFRFPGLKIDSARHEVLVDGQAVDFTVKEFNLLLFLAKNRERVKNRQQIWDNIWGNKVASKSRTIDVHIRRIRKKLAGASHYLKTLHGIGYKFKGDELN